MNKHLEISQPASFSSEQTQTIVVAGGTGKLGFRIASYLLQSGAAVKALVRKGNTSEAVSNLRKEGAEICEVDFYNAEQMVNICLGTNCVVSALSGLHNVIVEAQTKLLNAAVKAGVPRFMPSDYCIDFSRLQPGGNRNLDLRREFAKTLDQAPIAATSVLNGMFADLLKAEAPLIQPAIQRVIYWGDKNQPLDFTSMDDTARITAFVALDKDTPRFLRFAGEVASINRLKEIAAEAYQKEFQLLRAGGLNVLKGMIKVTRFLIPKKKEVFPPWQGMQYLHDMLSGVTKLDPLDNNRYPQMRWTSIREVLTSAEIERQQVVAASGM